MKISCNHLKEDVRRANRVEIKTSSNQLMMFASDKLRSDLLSLYKHWRMLAPVEVSSSTIRDLQQKIDEQQKTLSSYLLKVRMAGQAKSLVPLLFDASVSELIPLIWHSQKNYVDGPLIIHFRDVFKMRHSSINAAHDQHLRGSARSKSCGKIQLGSSIRSRSPGGGTSTLDNDGDIKSKK